MSVSSVALSSVTASNNANALLEAAQSPRQNKPAAAQDEQKPVKAAVPPKVGQVIDISA